MKQITLDFSGISSRDELHTMLAYELCMPTYYGRNLDALYDCLTELADCELSLVEADQLVEALGRYGELVLRVLSEAAEQNPTLELIAD